MRRSKAKHWEISKFGLTDEDREDARNLVDATDQEKILFITNLAKGMRFLRGYTSQELAAIWGMRLDRVSELAKTAQIAIAVAEMIPQTVDEARAGTLARMEHIQFLALRNKKGVLSKDGEVVYMDAPDYNAAIKAEQVRGDVLGLGSRRMIEQANEMRLKSKEELEALAKAELTRGLIQAEGVSSDEIEVGEVQSGNPWGEVDSPDEG